MDRISWDEYFMEMTDLISKRSTCIRRQVGSIIVSKNNQILSTGYNGSPKGITHCDSLGCMRQTLNVPSGERHELCRAVHAEANSIVQCAVHGVSTEGATIYVNTSPCSMCMKLIINAGIKRIVVRDSYPDELSKELLLESGIKCVVMPSKVK